MTALDEFDPQPAVFNWLNKKKDILKRIHMQKNRNGIKGFLMKSKKNMI